ncbi:hypothetical protein [Paenarthrobacter sp. CAP02]|uniref:hypothetical protein n=1 Tax=Paenarthrobacter sp. CAP02 TaxID=3158144 RepID=UPI0032DBAEDD
MASFTPKMYAWRRPLWPVTTIIIIADVVIGFLITKGTDPAIGTAAAAITIVWLVLGQSIGPKLRNAPKTET